MTDTIVAISTANASGAIGIIRISGSKVLEITSAILQKKNQPLTIDEIEQNPRTAIFCDLYDGENKLDQILFLYFKSPQSFTGEDMAELHLHGNSILLKTTLELIFKHGARPALQGEFSRRAYFNGKMDLTGTEAIARLISSRSRFELELAQKNIFGELSRLTSQIRSELINLKAECEAEIDFSTENLTYETLAERKSRILNLINLCSNILLKSERADKIISQQKIVLFGEPNTGKSSLLNKLIGKERAIISDIPGTTRDYIAEDLTIDGIPVQLVDTAGVRHTEDVIEKKGIEHSKNEFKNANIRLYLIDTSTPFKIDEFLKEEFAPALKTQNNIVIVANKIDIKDSSWDANKNSLAYPIVEISCKTGEGIETLIKIITDKLQNEEHAEDYILLEDRNKFHFNKIKESLIATLKLIDQDVFTEIYIKEIDTALDEIGLINGKIQAEEVLGRIFSRFCVGK